MIIDVKKLFFLYLVFISVIFVIKIHRVFSYLKRLIKAPATQLFHCVLFDPLEKVVEHDPLPLLRLGYGLVQGIKQVDSVVHGDVNQLPGGGVPQENLRGDERTES
jgi:hypothetical protein